MSVAVEPHRTVQPARPEGAPPATVSLRRHLRDGLPEVYRLPDGTRENLGMRFLHALEQVLDPAVATMDSLPAHLSPDLAPDHVLLGMASWLGVDEVEGLPPEQLREAVRSAGDLGRLRGTREGLQLVLGLFFPGVPMRIVDNGKVIVLAAGETAPVGPAPSFDVYIDEPLEPALQMAVAGCIDRWKPVHARYRLRVRRGDTGETMAAPAPSPPPEDDTT